MNNYSYPNMPANPVTLYSEIDAATFGSLGTNNLDHINTKLLANGNRDVDVFTNTALTGAEQTELDGIISSHTP